MALRPRHSWRGFFEFRELGGGRGSQGVQQSGGIVKILERGDLAVADLEVVGISDVESAAGGFARSRETAEGRDHVALCDEVLWYQLHVGTAPVESFEESDDFRGARALAGKWNR